MEIQRVTDGLPGSIGLLHRNYVGTAVSNDIDDSLRTNNLTILSATVPDIPCHGSQPAVR